MLNLVPKKRTTFEQLQELCAYVNANKKKLGVQHSLYMGADLAKTKHWDVARDHVDRLFIINMFGDAKMSSHFNYGDVWNAILKYIGKI